MRVVIRFGRGTRIGRVRRQNPGLALALGTLLTPAAVATSMLGLWRIAADLGWASDFAISSGFFSHWQVWIGAALLIEVCSKVLVRYGRRGSAQETVPEKARSRAV